MKKFAFAACLALGVIALLAPPQAFAADEKPFTIHGEVRMRAEYNNNATDFDDDGDLFGDGDDQAMYFPYRARIAAEGHFTDDVSAWIEFQNTGLFGEQGLFLGPFDATAPRRHNDPFRSTTSLYQAAITLNKLSSNSAYALDVQNLGTGGGLRVKSSSGSTLLDVTDSGVSYTLASITVPSRNNASYPL